jgi:hypothetical protein
VKNIQTFEEFILEDSKYSILRTFLETTLRDERKGYYWIFTNNVLQGNTLTGNINDGGGHGKYSKSEVEDDLRQDKIIIDRRLNLLKQAINEFNRENKTNLKFTYKLNSPTIKTGKWGSNTTYDADNLTAEVTIK